MTAAPRRAAATVTGRVRRSAEACHCRGGLRRRPEDRRNSDQLQVNASNRARSEAARAPRRGPVAWKSSPASRLAPRRPTQIYRPRAGPQILVETPISFCLHPAPGRAGSEGVAFPSGSSRLQGWGGAGGTPSRHGDARTPRLGIEARGRESREARVLAPRASATPGYCCGGGGAAAVGAARRRQKETGLRRPA